MMDRIKHHSLVIVAFLILIFIVLFSFLNQGDLKSSAAIEVKLNSEKTYFNHKPNSAKVSTQAKKVESLNKVKSDLSKLDIGQQRAQTQGRIQEFAVKFQDEFNRARYRTIVSQNANDGAAFAVRVSETLETLNELKKEKKILLSDQLDFLMNCSNQNNKDLPSFVQAYCLRTIEKLSMYEKTAKKAFSIAKRESHPAVVELVGILSSREE